MDTLYHGTFDLQADGAGELDRGTLRWQVASPPFHLGYRSRLTVESISQPAYTVLLEPRGVAGLDSDVLQTWIGWYNGKQHKLSVTYWSVSSMAGSIELKPWGGSGKFSASIALLPQHVPATQVAAQGIPASSITDAAATEVEDAGSA